MIEVVERVVEMDGCYREKVMADVDLSVGWHVEVPSYAFGREQVQVWEDAPLGVWYAQVRYPYRGPLDVHYPDWPKKFRRMVCWAYLDEKVSQGMREGAALYASLFARWPGTAYIDRLPEKAEYGVEVDGVILIPADWAPQGCMLIGG